MTNLVDKARLWMKLGTLSFDDDKARIVGLYTTWKQINMALSVWIIVLQAEIKVLFMISFSSEQPMWILGPGMEAVSPGRYFCSWTLCMH